MESTNIGGVTSLGGGPAPLLVKALAPLEVAHPVGASVLLNLAMLLLLFSLTSPPS